MVPSWFEQKTRIRIRKMMVHNIEEQEKQERKREGTEGRWKKTQNQISVHQQENDKETRNMSENM